LITFVGQSGGLIAAIYARLNIKATDRAAQVQAERGPSFCELKGPDPLIPEKIGHRETSGSSASVK
jgi:hypothetical protein